MTDLAALAEKALPCKCASFRREVSGHSERCHAPARPAILSALREARDAGLEAAAAWHDGEADRLRALAALYEKTCFFQKAEMERLRASFHETSAAAIRALKGKEG